ncbi:hypothetical protein ACH4PW_13975 [Streptomyces sp. NPDC017082]|uniref:hypothetical protein n=1 Tax=Streptomyces sp. NPDC017082 TaxID=3364974 RepID=UPI0037A6F125
MTEPDCGEGLIRLEKLISEGLHERITPTNRARLIGWGFFFGPPDPSGARAASNRRQRGGEPDRRRSLEHSVTLRWCVDQGDRIGDIHNRKLGMDQIQLAKAVRADGTADRYADAYQVLAATAKTVKESISPDPNERLAKIEHLMTGYGLTKEWSFYTAESRFTQPTLTGTQMFFQDDGEAFRVSQKPIDEELVAFELAGTTGGRLLELARREPKQYAQTAAQEIRQALTRRGPEASRSHALDRIGLAQCHFLLGDLTGAVRGRAGSAPSSASCTPTPWATACPGPCARSATRSATCCPPERRPTADPEKENADRDGPRGDRTHGPH